MNIQELIQKNKSEFQKHFKENYQNLRYRNIDEAHSLYTIWHIQSLKDLIDAVIEDEEKAMQPFKVSENMEEREAWNASKQDTIYKLKAIREML